MPLWRRRERTRGYTLDEFVDGGSDRAPSPLDLSGDRWQARLAEATRGPAPKAASELALPAFSLIRGGDLFERAPGRKPPRTDAALLDSYRSERLRASARGMSREVRDAALHGVSGVLAGNPALCKRMLLAKPITVVVVPKGGDFRRFGFPGHTHPSTAGVFWNGPGDETALLGLREELVLEKPWLMVHEMAHAVHLMGFTEKERAAIDQMLMPVYRSKRWVEEAVAIYAERAFGAEYAPDDLAAPGLYGKTRRDWDPQHVFSLFVKETFRPQQAADEVSGPSKPARLR